MHNIDFEKAVKTKIEELKSRHNLDIEN